MKQETALKLLKAGENVFLTGSAGAAKNIAESVIDEVIITDSIPLSDEIRALGKVKQLTLAPMLAEAIRRISNEESISAMFEH
jgi:ribose-phosphate pyrophosphokinase